jgi:hypothetical protein
MANSILTPTAVTRESLRVLHQKLTFIGSINRQYDASFAKEGAKIGDSLKIRLPNQYTVTTGANLSTQDTTEVSTTLQIATQKHVGMNFTTAELTLSMDDFSKRVIDPAMAVLAANIEADALSMRKDVYQQANNTAAAITFANVLAGRRKLNDSLAPPNDRTALLSSNDSANLVDALKGLFQDEGGIAKQYREGYMGRTAGFDFAESTHLSTQTRGTGDANYLVNTSSGVTSGSGTIAVTAGTGTIKQGEVVTIAGMDSVHPETKVDSGLLQQFVVTADYAGGAGNISVSPAPVTSGATQNVVINSAGASKALVIVGTVSTNYGQSMVYQEDAFTFATADLVMPKGVDWGAREVFDGISLRIVRDYDINSDRLPTRVDVLYGYKTLRPQLACRLANLAG